MQQISVVEADSEGTPDPHRALATEHEVLTIALRLADEDPLGGLVAPVDLTPRIRASDIAVGLATILLLVIGLGAAALAYDRPFVSSTVARSLVASSTAMI